MGEASGLPVIEPKDLFGLLSSGARLELLDLRIEPEFQILRIEGARLCTRALVDEMFSRWPKDTAIVFYDHFGPVGIEAVAAVSRRGFTNARALRGGIDAWSREVDPLIPRYP
jgi:adenylyltransferase/sulfurtransferase